MARLFTAAALALVSAASAQGTLVKDINPPNDPLGTPSHPQRFIALRDKLVFAAIQAPFGQEPWVSDGTEAGTFRLKDIHPTGSSQFHDPVVLDDRVLFLAQDADNWELWSTDATPSGTVHLKNVGPFVRTGTGPMIVLGDQAYFFVEPDGPNQLWKSDGTSAGTVLVTSAIGNLDFDMDVAVYRDELYFSQWGTPVGSNGLWKSDGSAADPVHVADPWPGIGGDPRDLTVAGDYLFFTALTPDGRELWRTDGTPGETIQLADIWPGSFGSEPGDLVALDNGILLCIARNGPTHGVWRSDGTPGGTYLLCPVPNLDTTEDTLVSFGDEAWFLTGYRLWRTDGTCAGSELLTTDSALGSGLVGLGSRKLVVWTRDRASGYPLGGEPYLSDGTGAGTTRVADVWPGSGDSRAYGYTRAGDYVFFTADDGVHDEELHAFRLTDFGGWVAEPFGTGCGSSGTPALSLDGELVLASTVSFELENAAPLATTGLYYSFTPAPRVFGDCTLYLSPPLRFATGSTDAAGALSLPLAVPPDPGIVGTYVAVQAVTFVPGGPLFGVAELSNGLETIVGN